MRSSRTQEGSMRVPGVVLSMQGNYHSRAAGLNDSGASVLRQNAVSAFVDQWEAAQPNFSAFPPPLLLESDELVQVLGGIHFENALGKYVKSNHIALSLEEPVILQRELRELEAFNDRSAHLL